MREGPCHHVAVLEVTDHAADDAPARARHCRLGRRDIFLSLGQRRPDRLNLSLALRMQGLEVLGRGDER